MYTTKEIVQEIRRVVKRRKKLLIITPIFFVLLSVGALYVIEPKYESSISIWVQKEEALNPLVFYEMATNRAGQDRLKSFREIIYSRSTIEKLIDSLGLDRNVWTELQRQKLVNDVRQNIITSLRASDALEITYFDRDPVRAKDGVTLLSNHFIQTRLRLDNRRNDETVKFFQAKLDELEEMVDSKRNQIVNTTASRQKEQPIDRDALQGRLQTIDLQLDQLEWKTIEEENKLKSLKSFISQDSQSFSLRPLYKLPLGDTPLGSELGQLLSRYDELKQRYTDDYPEVRTLRTRIIEVVRRIPPAIESKLQNLSIQQKDLNRQRSRVINDMEKSFVASQQNNSKQSNFSIYQELYSEMKIKLEQARMSRDIGDKTAEQFVVLDPPFIAEEPSSPDRQLVIGVGLLLGIVFGVMFMGVAEVLDTTIRSEEDLEFNKPIIAYLSDGRL